MLHPAQPVAQHTKTALPRPGEGSDPFAQQRDLTPFGDAPGSRQPGLAPRVPTKVDTYRADRPTLLRRYLFPGNACRSSSTSTRWFSE